MTNDEAEFYVSLADAKDAFEVVRLIMQRLFPKPFTIIKPTRFVQTYDYQPSQFNSMAYAQLQNQYQAAALQNQWQAMAQQNKFCLYDAFGGVGSNLLGSILSR